MAPEKMLLRYRYPDGRVMAALPMYVVEWRSDAVVGWLSEGSQISYWATVDGADPRTIPIGQRFQQRLDTGLRRWSGSGVLRVISLEECWQVLHFWDEVSGEFLGWYVNLESSKRVHGATLDAVDWYLDLLISPSLVVTWKDVDEAAAATGTSYLRERDLQTARLVGDAMAEDPRAFIDRIGDWTHFRPKESWGPLDLPDSWYASP